MLGIICQDDREDYQRSLNNVIKEKTRSVLNYSIHLNSSEKVQVVDYVSFIESSNEQQFPVITGLIIPDSQESQQVSSLFMDKFSAGMIHDFKNLLSGVQNIVEWVMSEAKFQPQIYQALNKTINYMDQANSLIGNVLKVH